MFDDALHFLVQAQEDPDWARLGQHLPYAGGAQEAQFLSLGEGTRFGSGDHLGVRALRLGSRRVDCVPGICRDANLMPSVSWIAD
jgi:hypothetical protein